MHRVTQAPVSGSITERGKHAQQMRNELAVYKRLNGPTATVERDKCLTRIEGHWHRILGLEGCSGKP